MAKLLELAERCEKATGPDRDLDLAICLATRIILPKLDPAMVMNIEADPHDSEYVLYDYENEGCTDSVPDFTSSIDAAMILVPEGSAGIELVTLHDRPAAYVQADGLEWDDCNCIAAATPALALCAAALRARATHPVDHSKGAM